MNLAHDYLTKLAAKLATVTETQQQSLAEAAQMIADAYAADHMLYAFGCGHSALLAQEIYYRAGGLMLVEPIFGEDLLMSRRPVTVTTDAERLPGYATLLLNNSGAQ